MTAPSASVIVVSRARPDALARCLRAILQLRYPMMEVVIVADPAGLKAIESQKDIVKTVSYDEPNISTARNLGIQAAAGEVVAFIDDDAVPEPSWLAELVKGFTRDDVGAVGGFTRGRNGISYQWTGQSLDENGVSFDLPALPADISVPEAPTGHVIRTHGTNMAFRRDVLATLGGFDPAFRFYLDEGDVHQRLARAGWKTALVPTAEDHHGFYAGPYRTASRLPISLYEPYRSHTLYIRKWGGDLTVREALLAHDHARLSRHLIAGTCEPRDLPRLKKTAQDGWEDGLTAAFGTYPSFDPPPPFRNIPQTQRHGPTSVLAGRIWAARSLRAQAADRAKSGETMTLFLFDPTARYHHVRYRTEGYWEQSGGLFGRANRTDPILRFFRFKPRLAAEIARIGQQRLLNL